ncbi:trans-sialidase, putative, partial [Trypanosoma cruzi marinkellei]
MLGASKVRIPSPGEELRTVPEIPPKPTAEFEDTPVKRNEEHHGSHAALGNEGPEKQKASPSNVLAPEDLSASILNASNDPIPSPGEFSVEEEEETPATPAGEESPQAEEEETAQEVEEAQPRPQSSAEASEGSAAAAVSSGGRGSHGPGKGGEETDSSSGSASPPAPSRVSSGPDASHSTEMTPVDGATAAPGPRTDPATAQGRDKVLDGD